MTAVVVRRVLVAVDASACGRAALAAAAALASGAGAAVVALFVEDEDLLRLAALPRAVGFLGPGGARPLDPVSMARALRGVGEALRREVEDLAGRARVPASFRAVRGRVAPSIVAAARDVDVVVLGRRGTGAGGAGLGATARAVATAAGAVLLLDARDRVEGPVIVADDGGPDGAVALALAATLARAARGGLVALAPPGAGRARAEAAAAAAGEPPPTVRDLPAGGARALGRAARALGGRVLVLPRALAHDGDLDAVVAAAPGPVLLVGGTPPPT